MSHTEFINSGPVVVFSRVVQKVMRAL